MAYGYFFHGRDCGDFFVFRCPRCGYEEWKSSRLKGPEGEILARAFLEKLKHK